MNYKTENQLRLAIVTSKKLESYPKFVQRYFSRLKSERTKQCNYGFITELLEWLVHKNVMSEISEEEISKVTDADIIDYLESLEKGIDGKQNSLSSINTKKAVYGGFWSYLQDNHYVTENIIKKIPSNRFKEEIEHTIVVPDYEDIRRMLNRIRASTSTEFAIRAMAIVELFLGSGIRSEELIGLDTKDVVLNVEKPYIMVLGKGKQHAYDKVYISEIATDYLKRWWQFRRNKKVCNTNAFFVDRKGDRYSKAAIDSLFKNYSCGQITPHQLRHYFGTKLYNKTHNLVLVQKQLRHKSIETAAKYYVKVDDKEIADVIYKM